MARSYVSGAYRNFLDSESGIEVFLSGPEEANKCKKHVWENGLGENYFDDIKQKSEKISQFLHYHGLYSIIVVSNT